MQRPWSGWALGVWLTGAGVVFACGGDDRDFNGGAGASAGEGGSDNASAGSTTLPGAAGSDEPTDAGSSSGGSAGSNGVPSDAGAAGATDEPTPTCPEGYETWLSSSFSFPDGAIIGTADFPSMPWRSSGNLAIDTGRLTGAGTAVVSQAGSFPYAGTRLRFRARFSDSSQEVTVAANTADDGVDGIRISLAASGDLVLSEGASARGQAAFDPLDTGVDWFVEAELIGASARVTLASGSYGKPTSTIATIETDTLKETAQGVKAAVRLDSEVGIAAAVDELSVARCGVAAPEYEAKLIDTFERANSATIGTAELPATATWLDPSATFKIVDGGLQSNGELNVASIPLAAELPLSGLRIRTSVRAVTGGNSPYLWADVNFNVANGIRGILNNGFWVWGGPSESFFYTGIFPGGGEVKQNAVAATDIYFAQLDRDGDAAVLTVREQSFEGPILGVQFAGALKATPNPGGYLTVGDEGGQGTRWEDIRVDVLPVE